NRILDELERRVLAEIADREDRLEHRLESGVLALARQTIHLQEAFVGLLLDLDQVRNRNRRLDFRKVDALAVNVLRKAVHSLKPRGKAERSARALRTRGHSVESRSGLAVWDRGFAGRIPNPESPIPT